MMLAKELLEKGEDKIVVEYLETCKGFWSAQFSRYRIWKWNRIIKKDEIPESL